MRKQELIHIHALLEEIAENCEEHGVEIDLDTYQELGIHSRSVQYNKEAHHKAVCILVETITDSLSAEVSQTQDDPVLHV